MQQPVRKINNIRSRKNTGFFPSQKNGRPIAFESLLERDYLFLLEFDSSVLSFTEQPFTIECYFEGRKYRYTPDTSVDRLDKIQVVEVKPKKKLDQYMSTPKERAKLIAAHNYCLSKGYEFVTVTDLDIYFGPTLNNIKLLHGFSRLPVPAKEKMKIKSLALTSGQIEIDSLANKLSGQSNNFDIYLSYIYSLLYSKFLSFDITMPLINSSLVWL